MRLRFRCPNCHRVLAADDRYAGARFRCPGCRNPVTAPRPEDLLAQPAAAAEAAAPAQARDDETPAVQFGPPGGSDDEIDMTPMIDCVFLLLIFFIVTATFALQKSLEIPPPDQTDKPKKARTIEEIEKDESCVVVRIEKDNTIFVEGVEAPSKQELLNKLRDAREQPGPDGEKPTSMIVLADGEATHETVVMAIDAGNGVGMESVRLATVSEEDF